MRGPGSVVVQRLATVWTVRGSNVGRVAQWYSDWLRFGRSGDRIQVGARFSAPVQTGPGAHPASCTMSIGSFPGVKRPRRGVNHPSPSTAKVKEKVELYLYLWAGQRSRYSDWLRFGRSEDRIPVGGEFFCTCPDRPWGPPSLLYNGYRVFPGGKERPGRDADPSSPSSTAVMKGYSYTSTPPMGRTACTQPQCLYKGALCFFLRRDSDALWHNCIPYINAITSYNVSSREAQAMKTGVGDNECNL